MKNVKHRDRILIEVGMELAPFVAKDSRFRQNIVDLRDFFSSAYGVELPTVHIVDNANLANQEMAIYVDGTFVERKTFSIAVPAFMSEVNLFTTNCIYSRIFVLRNQQKTLQS